MTVHAPEPGNALEVERLTVHLGNTEVLRGLSFSVRRGALLAVIGPNGAGKTVLFRTLAGVLPHEGTVRWAPGTRIGYVPQKLDLERDLPVTGRDLLAARARLAGAPNDAVERCMARSGLSTEVLGTLIGALSGGQFQRLLMAFALLGDPTVLLLDEPTAGVDEPGQLHMNETVRRLQTESGVTVLLISHDLGAVSAVATDVLCLTHEHTCFGVSPRMLTADVAATVYGEPMHLVSHEHRHGSHEHRHD